MLVRTPVLATLLPIVPRLAVLCNKRELGKLAINCFQLPIRSALKQLISIRFTIHSLEYGQLHVVLRSSPSRVSSFSLRSLCVLRLFGLCLTILTHVRWLSHLLWLGIVDLTEHLPSLKVLLSHLLSPNCWVCCLGDDGDDLMGYMDKHVNKYMTEASFTQLWQRCGTGLPTKITTLDIALT